MISISEMVDGGRTLIGILLLISGTGKILDGSLMERLLRVEIGLSSFKSHCIRLVLPWIESGIGVSLIGGIFSPVGLLSAWLLFASFSSVLSLLALRGRRYIRCGCFGSNSKEQSVGFLLGFNLGLLGLASWELFVLPSNGLVLDLDVAMDQAKTLCLPAGLTALSAILLRVLVDKYRYVQTMKRARKPLESIGRRGQS